ncbi:MAG: hypothetical protein ACK2UK_18325 [Candidatus Promineifilaceae bacterium]
MLKRKMLAALLPGLLALLWALPVCAGGWATVGVIDMPEKFYAERPTMIEFMVWQHGNHAVHELTWGDGRTVSLEPEITLTSKESGEAISFPAERGDELGLFVAEITIPAAGEWSWEIAPDPLAGVSKMEPLEVLPAAEAPVLERPNLPAHGQAAGRSAAFALSGLLLGIALFTISARQRNRAK